MNVAVVQATNWGAGTVNIKRSVRDFYEHAKTSNNPHVATAGRVQMVTVHGAQWLHVKDLGVSGRVDPVVRTRVQSGTKNYLRHLAVKFLITVGVMYCSALVATLSAVNLTWFAETGASVFHPLLSVLALGASVSLMMIATFAMFVASRYFLKAVGWL